MHRFCTLTLSLLMHLEQGTVFIFSMAKLNTEAEDLEMLLYHVFKVHRVHTPPPAPLTPTPLRRSWPTTRSAIASMSSSTALASTRPARSPYHGSRCSSSSCRPRYWS